MLGMVGPTSIPAAVLEWMQTHDARRPAQPMALVIDGGAVLVRALPNRGDDRRRVLLIEGDPAQPPAAVLCAPGLTVREPETLHARRTVDKHLQNTATDRSRRQPCVARRIAYGRGPTDAGAALLE